MKKLQVMITSVAAIVLCICLITGSTLAILTKTSAQNISVTSGHVSVEATAENFRWYSVKPYTVDDKDAPAEPDVKDESDNEYYYKEVTGGRFLSGGRAIVSAKDITLLDITAGDKIEFDIKVKNNSDIAVQYYANLSVEEDGNLLENLDVNFDGAGMLGVGNVRNEWTTVAPSEKELDTVRVTVSVPVTADKEVQCKSLKLKFAVFAQQYTSPIEYIAEVNGVKYTTLAEAVENTEAGGVIELLRSTVAGEEGTEGEEGEILIDKSLTVRSAQDGDLKPQHSLSGARIRITEGAVVSFDNVGFEGNSYINVSKASALKLTDCTAIVNPFKIYDAYNRKYVDRAAFIVSDESNEIGIKLTVENCKIFAALADSDLNSAAIYMSSYVSGGTVIRNNQFGGEFEGGRYASSVVCLLKGETNTATTLEGNTFYGSTPLYVGKEGKAVSGSYGTYTVRSLNNTIINSGEETGFAEIVGDSAITLLDTGSKVNGRALACADIRAEKLRLFYGVNVVFNGLQYSRGTFKLGTISEESFRGQYVADGASVTVI